MNAVRVLGACGLASACLSAVGGFADATWLIGIAGVVMLGGNVYALARGGSR